MFGWGSKINGCVLAPLDKEKDGSGESCFVGRWGVKQGDGRKRKVLAGQNKWEVVLLEGEVAWGGENGSGMWLLCMLDGNGSECFVRKRNGSWEVEEEMSGCAQLDHKKGKRQVIGKGSALLDERK